MHPPIFKRRATQRLCRTIAALVCDPSYKSKIDVIFMDRASPLERRA